MVNEVLHRYITEEIEYTGEQLRSLWAFKEFDLQGDSIVAFAGPCHVRGLYMVDQADVKGGLHIYSERMLHFIAEHFDMDLEKTICRQRLLVSLAQDLLMRQVRALRVQREGDDLYAEGCKMSVSIATLTPVSTVIHFGINISSANTPVATKGLNDFDIDAYMFAEELLDRYVAEMEEIQLARAKVRGVE
ncbi:MAG: DUF366 family protein [bacterium]|nr:DUF366 family protein [bacterium]MDD3806324.1 DUF366 family protein [bacterium]MDD4153197.1 DUF366 family protein [bacterium]MDD4558485.1 DUF366 family protein [bacterium]